jgi:hypothetical protein
VEDTLCADLIVRRPPAPAAGAALAKLGFIALKVLLVAAPAVLGLLALWAAVRP